MTADASPAHDLPDIDADAIAGATVLLVDDHEQNLELLQAYLEELGCRIAVARDGQAAVEAVETDPPDLVLLDVMMPKLSGYQVCEKIKSDPDTREIPVIMVTALGEISDVERAVDVGADDFLTKPVHQIELVTRVKSLLRVRLLKRQLAEALQKVKELDSAKRAAADDD
jgi:two-component system cell cycle response regulator